MTIKAIKENPTTIFCITALFILFAAVWLEYRSMYTDYDRRYNTGNNLITQKEYTQAANAYKWAVTADKTRPEAYGALQSLYGSVYYKNMDEYENICQQAALYADAQLVENYSKAHSVFMNSNYKSVKTADGNTFHFYDENDKIAVEFTYSGGEMISYKEYEYAESGLPVKDTLTYADDNRFPVVTQYFYDDDNSLIKKKTRDMSDEDFSDITYHYNNGEMVQADYGGMYAVYYSDYYKNGKLYRRHYLREPDNLSHTTDYSDYFDENGLKIKTVYNDGYRFQYTVYTYSDNITESYTYYNDGVLKEYTKTTSNENGKKTVLYKKYNRFGEVVKEALTVGSIVKSVTRSTDNILNPRPLTEEEIIRANSSNLLSFIHSDEYETGEDIVLFDIVSECRDKNNLLTDDDKYELSLLKAEGVDLSFELIETDNHRYYKIPYNTVNQMLNRYMNLSAEDLRTKAVYPNSGAVYSESCNAFYISYNSGFVNNRRYEFIGGVVGDNIAKLYTKNYTLTLINENGRYIVTSCISEDHSDLVPEQEVSENRNNSKPLVLKEVFLHTDSAKGTAYNNAMAVFNKYINDSYASIRGKEINEDDYIVKDFFLYDLTGDGVPELISRYPDAFAPYDVYMCINNNLKHVGTFGGYGGDGGITFLKNGMIMGQLYKIVFKNYEFFTVNHDGSVTTVRFSRKTDYDDRDVTHYNFNSKEVTRDEYIRLTKHYLDAAETYADLQKIELYK